MLVKGTPGLCFNLDMSSYQYKKSYCEDKTVVSSSNFHIGNLILMRRCIKGNQPLTEFCGNVTADIFHIHLDCFTSTNHCQGRPWRIWLCKSHKSKYNQSHKSTSKEYAYLIEHPVHYGLIVTENKSTNITNLLAFNSLSAAFFQRCINIHLRLLSIPDIVTFHMLL